MNFLTVELLKIIICISVDAAVNVNMIGSCVSLSDYMEHHQFSATSSELQIIIFNNVCSFYCVKEHGGYCLSLQLGG